ncbi:hypothetical protein HY571_01210, partial [Candidatus Micrarchaeota archaeon]|nr:hypothetical protein [Candidatus Micrarchaeota archaeon]
HVEDKAEEKTHVFFAREVKFDYKSLEALCDFFESLRDFSHHLSENHYYSENINKNLVKMNLDMHALGLEIRELEATGAEFYSSVHCCFLAAEKPVVDKKRFSEFSGQVGAAWSKAHGISAGLKALVEGIKTEYGK